MAKTIANVLVGEATLYVRQPNDSIAEWDTAKVQAGTHSVKLYKSGSGNAGSTHLELSGLTSRGITMAHVAADPTDFSFYYWLSGAVGNYVQFEMRFEDPDSEGWAEITVVNQQTKTPVSPEAWVQETLAGADLCGIGGHAEDGTPFFLWDLSVTITDMATDCNTQGCTDAGAFILERVRLELWEAEPVRTAYIDTVEIDGTVYTIEPGGTGPGIALSSAFTEVGYTEDGVTMEYAAEETDIMVHEETFPIDSVITKEGITVTCNMAEASLTNINNAMAGAVLSGNKLTLGDGVNKTMNLKIEGTNPAGYLRAIHIPKAVASGTVGMSYKKGEKTIVPVSFKALKTTDSEVCTIVDNAA